MRVNWSKVILAGIAAGVVGLIGAVLVDGMLLHHRWVAQMQSMGKSPTPTTIGYAIFFLWGIVAGIATAWLYAALRNHYLPGPRTALIAGFVVWVLNVALPNLFMYGSNLFGPRLLAASTAGALVYMLAAGLLAGWLYRPAEEVVAITPGVSA